MTAQEAPEVALELAQRLRALPWVTELWVGGSVATGDYRAGVSDLDLVAIVEGEVDDGRRAALVTLHLELDAGPGHGLDLGCVYVEAARVRDPVALHATWTHGSLVSRTLSGVARAELVLHGWALLGREPQQVLAPVSGDDVRAAARAEVVGYWAWAARRPTMWLDPVIADLGLTSMARGRHALATGTLLTKTAAVECAAAPPWLVDQLRARRHGEAVVSPLWATAWIAWRDARRTVAAVRRGAPRAPRT